MVGLIAHFIGVFPKGTSSHIVIEKIQQYTKRYPRAGYDTTIFTTLKSNKLIVQAIRYNSCD